MAWDVTEILQCETSLFDVQVEVVAGEWDKMHVMEAILACDNVGNSCFLSALSPLPIFATPV